MRIVIDLQGAQGANRNRGIGRYSLSLAKAIIKNRGEHDIFIALNRALTNTAEQIRSEFNELIPQEKIFTWNYAGRTDYIHASNTSERKSAELIREASIASIKPDVILVTSMFEGLGDSATTSTHRLDSNIKVVAVLYDLIPLLNRSPYLDNPVVNEWYEEKLAHLKKADLLLSISESSRNEAIKHIQYPSKNIINISTAADSQFRKLSLNDKYKTELRKKYGLSNEFVMYTGGIDHRKNIDGLIRAFAQLSPNILVNTQLAIVCSIQQSEVNRLNELANSLGLNEKHLILTGFVPEDDLVGLYNICKFFVFPSKHEGFGLPALEAMCCGKAVLGSNTSSLPEVIGCSDALFNPFNEQSITEKLSQALTDDEFLIKLENHANKQASSFSWDRTAISALEAVTNITESPRISMVGNANKRKLAYLSPLPPMRSGISDYSADLLPHLSNYYDIEVIISDDPEKLASCEKKYRTQTVSWFLKNKDRYDRVLYHFGNSEFHQHMFELIQQVPGAIVLHDFYLSGIVAHRDVHCGHTGSWSKELYNSHGYLAFNERYSLKDSGDVVLKYPCNLSVLQQSLGVIVHSKESCILAEKWYGIGSTSNWFQIPLLRVKPRQRLKLVQSRHKKLGFNKQDFIVASFGLLGSTKLNHRLLNAWIDSPLSKNKNCKLIFVGLNDPGKYGKKLIDKIKKSGLSNQISITGWTDAKTYREYLQITDLAVQLRTLSRGETSAAVLDCMNYGVATIVNSNGSMSHIEDDAVFKLRDDFSDSELVDALTSLWKNRNLRNKLGENSSKLIHTKHAPEKCAQQYFDAIEKIYADSKTGLPSLITEISKLDNLNSDNLNILAKNIDESVLQQYSCKQIFIDISELVNRDSATGIQRVVRSILQQVIINPPRNVRIEPVYASLEGEGYKYARVFTSGFLDCPTGVITDSPVSYNSGDIFLGLDLQPHVVRAQRKTFNEMREKGVTVKFVVYDLLCILMPQYFVDGAREDTLAWLDVVLENHGALCISKSTADSLKDYISQKEIKLSNFDVSWFHLGADIVNSKPTYGMPSNAINVLDNIASATSFLMVGTIEPRKGYDQTLTAFENLWKEGEDCKLVIVGKVGWLVENVVARFRNHPKLNSNLFWLEKISDEYLEEVYKACSCLLLASEGEGFGLPLIEAVQHGLPIIARNLPVFNEIAGDSAYYFENTTKPSVVSIAIKEWLYLYKEKKHPQSDDITYLNWNQSAQQLLSSLIT